MFPDAGYAFKRLHVVGGEFIESASRYSFRIALPVMLFNSVCSSDIAELLDVPFLLLCIVCMCVSPMLIMAFSRPFIKDRRKLGAFVQGVFRGNVAIVAAASLAKLALQPMACLALALLLGCRGTSLISVLIMSGVSTASGTYVMAQNMNSDGQLASSILTVTTLFSSTTLTLWIFLMGIAELL